MTAWLRQLRNRILASFANEHIDRELEAEMASHLAMATEENIKNGMPAEEARRQALIRFGGLEQAKQQHREARGFQTLDILMQDLRYAFRTMRREKLFTIVAVL